MLNEWEEFQRYIETPVYVSAGKNDHSYLGRFPFEMFAECTGLPRVLTVLARGYLFHDADGAILAADPRDRIGMAWRALCAWCSVPDNGKPDPKNKWKFKSDFTELHEEFPELVDERGGGWYYRHVHGVVAYTQSHPDAVMESALNRCRKLDETFDAAWRSKAVQCQIPPLAPTTKAQWLFVLYGDSLQRAGAWPAAEGDCRTSASAFRKAGVYASDENPTGVEGAADFDFLLYRQPPAGYRLGCSCPW